MTDERLLREAIARCVSIMVFHHNTGQTPGSADRMATEIRGEAGEVAGLGDDVGRLVSRPIEIEPMARLGPESGPRVFSSFMRICHPDPVEAGRPSIVMASGMSIGCGPGEAKPDRAAPARRLGINRTSGSGMTPGRIDSHR